MKLYWHCRHIGLTYPESQPGFKPRSSIAFGVVFQANTNIKTIILDALRSSSSQESLLYITFHSTAATVGINSEDTGLREKHFWMPERSGLSKSGTAGALLSSQTFLSGPVRGWEGTSLLLVVLALELRAWEVVWSAWGGRQEVENYKLSFQLVDEYGMETATCLKCPAGRGPFSTPFTWDLYLSRNSSFTWLQFFLRKVGVRGKQLSFWSTATALLCSARR